ncbi:MAG: hypothetical protein H0T46_05055 [Deltaproteobacteria bacterium]|nr:hypothetical protein [Deltaproteobacteria bacterium]
MRALASDPRLITFARDPDVTVRRAALAALSKRALAPPDLVALVAALDVAGDDLADVLVGAGNENALLAACASVGSVSALRLAASLQRQHGAQTRTCTRCRRIPRSESWTSDGRPAEIHELNVVQEIARADGDEGDWKLVRCPTCSSCYATTYWCQEQDPLMRRDYWTVKRLTLGEIQRDYGPDFVPDWTAALVADLDHPDPHWRTEAAHDLARDLLAAGHFDRIESELLRYPRRQVAREALRALSDSPVDPPVSPEVLKTLAASTDEETHAFATTLLTVQRGTSALDDLELESYPVLHGIELLLRRGGSVSPRFAARLVEHMLGTTPYRWRFDHLVKEVALAEHLPATLVRLRAALRDPSTRTRALELARTLADESLLDEETLAVALQQADTDLEATLAIALAASDTLIPDIANRTLRAGEAHDARKVIGRIGEALSRGEDIRWAVPALGANVLRHAEGTDAAVMLDQLASKGVDLTDAVQDLFAALDRVMPYSAHFAAHALVRHHMRRSETDAVLALLSHEQSSVRGDAATVLADAPCELPAAIISRLHEMTTDRASRPRRAAEQAVRLHASRASSVDT